LFIEFYHVFSTIPIIKFKINYLLQMKFGSLLSVMLLFFLVSSCTYDNEQDLFEENECGDLTEVSLKNDIVPILQNQCYSCHGVGVETGGIDLETYDRLVEVADNGKLVGALRHESGFSAMPPSGQMLPECDIRKIRKWVDQGALNN
jgi:hypothetical protein